MVKRAFLLALLLAGACGGNGAVRVQEPQAEQPLLSPQGCVLAADMALVARALSADGISRAQADRIMALVYPTYPPELRARMADLGYARNEQPMDLARMILQHCAASGGRPEPSSDRSI
jgi:hypothetical protein